MYNRTTASEQEKAMEMVYNILFALGFVVVFIGSAFLIPRPEGVDEVHEHGLLGMLQARIDDPNYKFDPDS